MVGWRKSRNSISYEVALKKTWRDVIRLGPGLSGDGPNRNASFRQESDDYDDDDVPMMMMMMLLMVVVVLNIYFV